MEATVEITFRDGRELTFPGVVDFKYGLHAFTDEEYLFLRTFDHTFFNYSFDLTGIEHFHFSGLPVEE